MTVTLPSRRPVGAMARHLARAAQRVRDAPTREVYGTVVDVQGAVARISAADLQVGDVCEFLLPDGAVPGEVIGLQGALTLVTPLGRINGVGQGTLVRRVGSTLDVPVSDALLGLVVDGLGRVVGPAPEGGRWTQVPLRNAAPAAMDRLPLDTPVTTGLRVIDGTATLARGQRIMVAGPPGVGKSSLLAAIASNSDVDVVVFGLIGERGREINEFITRRIPEATRRRLVVVAAPADRPALERIYAANTATAIAEGFRAQGKSVLLILDSLTRVARAMREVGLAAGEPPTRRGYPASVFAALPELLERPGRTRDGAITAIYSVLLEGGDAASDPIVEETRSLVDGHLILDADLFAAGRFPPVDVTDSLSRVMADVASPDHVAMAADLRGMLARYAKIELLLQIGEYQRGQDRATDRALDLYPEIDAFLSQSDLDPWALYETVNYMGRILE